MKIDIPPRRVIPRWRDSSQQLLTAESLPIERSDAPPALPENYWLDLARGKIEEWKSDPSPGMAADLLSLGVFPESHPVLAPVARAIRESKTELPGSVQHLIRKVLGEPEPQVTTTTDSRTAVQLLRRRLNESYENPIALIDYARHQIILGNAAAADHAIRIACDLAPRDRFVLRTAARFYVHIGDPDQALRLLARSGRATSDPWLLSCDITVNSVAGRAPRNVRRAKEIISTESIPPDHLTELASALATLELEAGRMKAARRLFTIALRKPNDNSVSQVQWASIETGLPFAAREEWLQGLNFDELRCLRAHAHGDFPRVVDYANSWHADEPFSSRPLVMASHVNGVLGDFAAAESIARRGLTSNPTDSNLLNNLLYAYAAQGKVDQALAVLRRILQLQKQTPTPHTIANIACLLIRTGQIEQGIKAYRSAIARAQNPDFTVRALAFLSRELYVARDPQWSTIKNECETLIAKQESPIASTVLHTIDPTVQVPSPSRQIGPKAGRWVYNRAKNLLIVSPDRLF